MVLLLNGADGGVRLAEPRDIADIRSVHKAALYGLCCGFYEASQLAGWSKAFSAAVSHLFEEEDSVLYVAEHEGVLAGFGLRKGHIICALYIRPEFAGLGLGRELMQHLESSSVFAETQECVRFSVSASLNAIGFYEQLGYVEDGVDEMLLPDGIVLPCVAMHKDTC
ncbi:MAG: GNAT family N-acetyltransferase [Desulfovibrio sp.]|uniref:GNAT family N-acetyltransferase n=1 Tax=Desulfovibrio sp. 7SRBS1 TaxID=3378064 RepID=UPI003B410051